MIGDNMDSYDGGSLSERAVALWQPQISDADGDIIPQKRLLDLRVRDALRNDSYVQSGQRLYQDTVVGAVYMLSSEPKYKTLGLTETWADEHAEEVEEKFTLAAESSECWFDAAGRNTFTEHVRLAVGISVACGECLASSEWITDKRRPFKTAFQMIEVDRIRQPGNAMPSARFHDGVEFDAYFNPIAYHVLIQHPGVYWPQNNSEAYVTKRVPIRKPWGRRMLMHVFEQNRPGQNRGVSTVTSALRELRLSKKYRDTELQRKILTASYAASIESELPSAEIMQLVGGENPANVGAYVNAYMGNYLKTVQKYSGKAQNLQIDGVKIPHLPPGSKLNFYPAAAGSDVGSEFEHSLLRYLAASFNVSYEELARDYSQTNFSSARAAMNQTAKSLAAFKKMTADRMANFMYCNWYEEQLALGTFTTAPKNAVNMFYEMPLAKEAFTACQWIGQAKGQVDELAETEAAALRLESNLSTLQIEAPRIHGMSWRQVLRQQKREKDLKDELGLVELPETPAAAAPAVSQGKKPNE